jgi:hypothetical protein
VTTRRDTIVGVAWIAGVFAVIVALLVGLIQVANDPSAENAYRWVMALLFIGAPLGFLTLRYETALRRVFKR